MLVDKVKLLASVRVGGQRFVLGFSELGLSMTIPLDPTTKQKVNLVFCFGYLLPVSGPGTCELPG